MADAIDAVVVGSGPNGLAAAIVLARAGLRVVVFEAQPGIGGGTRSAELTLPGFVHDVCSAVHPLAVASPFFRSLPLQQYGLEWIEPPVMLAHPFDDGPAAVVCRSLGETASGLGEDGDAYRRLMEPVVSRWAALEASVLGPIGWPRHPVDLARFSLRALRSADGLARATFRGERARALFAGHAAHGMLPLDRMLTAGFGLVLGALAHLVGWVVPRRGAQSIADALAAHFRSLGGEIRAGEPVASLDDLPAARAVLCDLSPRPFLQIAGRRVPASYRRKLERYRYGTGVCKVDWALDGPIPWRDEACRRAATLHLGATLGEIARSESQAWSGEHAASPFVILVQPTIVDPSRAPAGRHTAWAYCHMPHASGFDMMPRIEQQIERFAPGFRDGILARHVMGPADIERRNPNFVGGDIGSGAADVRQFFVRPTLSAYSTPIDGVYLCSAATPPGVGVHGMCGYFAARRALKDVFHHCERDHA